MSTVLWPATWGYYLSQIVTGSVPTPEVLLPAARDHFADHVRARGHFPILRIGQQPYGILPVCWSAKWESLEGRPLDAPLAALLTRLRTTWENSIPNVPRLPGASDPEAALVSLLGMTASSNSFVARNVIGPEYTFSYWDFIQKDIAKTWWTALTQKSLADTGDIASVMANTRLANSTYVKQYRSLSDVIVGPAPLDAMPSPSFIAQLAGLGWQALRDVALPPAPVPLLFLLLRHAGLRECLDTALDLLTLAGAAQAQERIEPELLGISSTATRPTAWDLLQRELPGQGPVGTFLDGAKKNPSFPAFVSFWNSFTQLSQFSATDLDALTREVFDLASYRLDAWITSLAHFRLDNLRTAQPNGGIVLGAYAWVENVQPQSPQAGSSDSSMHLRSTRQRLPRCCVPDTSPTAMPRRNLLKSIFPRAASELHSSCWTASAKGNPLGRYWDIAWSAPCRTPISTLTSPICAPWRRLRLELAHPTSRMACRSCAVSTPTRISGVLQACPLRELPIGPV